MLSYLKSFFVTPTALEMAVRELAEAKMGALQEQSMAEYTASETTKHRAKVVYHNQRIDRLTAYIQEQTKPPFKPGTLSQ